MRVCVLREWKDDARAGVEERTRERLEPWRRDRLAERRRGRSTAPAPTCFGVLDREVACGACVV